MILLVLGTGVLLMLLGFILTFEGREIWALWVFLVSVGMIAAAGVMFSRTLPLPAEDCPCACVCTLEAP